MFRSGTSKNWTWSIWSRTCSMARSTIITVRGVSVTAISPRSSKYTTRAEVARDGGNTDSTSGRSDEGFMLGVGMRRVVMSDGTIVSPLAGTIWYHPLASW